MSVIHPIVPLRPSLFVELQTVAPEIRVDLKYYQSDNFTGKSVAGYCAPVCLITKPAAESLAAVDSALKEFGLGLLVFDAYRPQAAVDAFMHWASLPDDKRLKARFYPDLEKVNLFKQGYLVARSSHSRGSTVDLTLVNRDTGELLDMGTEFDFFGERSWVACREISAEARAHRMLLQQLMERHGFVPYSHEWWHFTLQDEPYPDSYFAFSIDDADSI